MRIDGVRGSTRESIRRRDIEREREKRIRIKEIKRMNKENMNECE